jgi:signal transduction histidine kinase
MPVGFLFMSFIFANTKITFKKRYLLFFIIPMLSLIILWTNNYHNLFYKHYSINLKETIYGSYFIVHTIYSYLCLIIGMLYLVFYSIKNAGLFSKQSILIVFGTLFPVITNVLGFLSIIPMTIYMTPITFSIGLIFYSLAIFKFSFLKVAPIALQRIVDRMSDAYLVLNEENKITDFNSTFIKTFDIPASKLRNMDIFNLLSSTYNFKLDNIQLADAIQKIKGNTNTISFNEHFVNINKFFHIEINGIYSKENFLGTLLLLKDITQHTLDMETIKNNQEMLIEKERLASLGQMIGGIAHNLKTPIMSIAGAAEGLSDLINEYDNSIEDPNVNFKDHHEIASDMREWIVKTRVHLAYMSDVITAVKGQAVNFADNTSNGFTIDELVKHIDVLMKHELKNALIDLNTHVDINLQTEVGGNINSLVQVVNNIISNAIQAYKGEPNKLIDLYLYKENDNLNIKIQDYAGGLPEDVKAKLFKEMVTTKGKHRNRASDYLCLIQI